LTIIGCVAITFSPDLWTMMGCRVFLGVGVGITTVACPAYVAENAPDDKKGFLGTFFQLAITFSMFIAVALGYPFQNVANNFRIIYVIGAIPAIGMLVISIWMTESPIWKNQKKLESDPLLPLNKGSQVINYEQAQPKRGFLFLDLLNRGNLNRTLVGELLTVAQQLTGINAFMVFAPLIFGKAGLKDALLPTIGLQLWNFLTTFVSTFFVEKLGRRPLILVGTLVMTVSTLVLAAAFEWLRGLPLGVLAVITLLGFVAGFEAGLGPLFWVVATELFPENPELRGSALSLFNTTVWIFNLILVFGFPVLRESIGDAGVFWIFGGIGASTIILMYAYLPETSQRTLGKL